MIYLDYAANTPVDKEVLDLYELYPRDNILTKETYTPRETIELRQKLNAKARTLGK